MIEMLGKLPQGTAHAQIPVDRAGPARVHCT